MLPVLYSFRRCPYAIRARIALRKAGVTVELREVVLRDKPAALLRASSKATVPVLQLPDGRVIDESLAIMEWALRQHDPEGWLRRADETSRPGADRRQRRTLQAGARPLQISRTVARMQPRGRRVRRPRRR